MAENPLLNYRVISADEAEEKYAVSATATYPYQEFANEQEIRLYEGDLVVDGDFEADPNVDWVPYNTIVDGNLTVNGNLEWHDQSGGNLLFVTGSLRAHNVILQGCPDLVIQGDVTVDDTILAFYGEDGGSLVVKGNTTAKVLLSTYYFCMWFAREPDALVIADEHRIDCEVDFGDDELGRLVRPEFLDDGSLQCHDVADAIREGRPFLRNGVKTLAAMTTELLDALLADPDNAVELDLSDRRLKAIPEQVFLLPRLKRLNLADNRIEAIPAIITNLTDLEELNLAGNSLTALPDHIGRLAALKSLDLSYNADLTSLPDALGNLTNLTNLTARLLPCPLPDGLSRLSRLAHLSLHSWLSKAGPMPFPDVITRLTGLITLDLSSTKFTTLPDTLENLAELEELRLDGALPYLSDLTPLTSLPKLTRLFVDGRCPSGDRYPSFDLLAPLWEMSRLEELGVDRFGRETVYQEKRRKHVEARPALTKLPDEVFDALTRLRRLDLSFNELRDLPESLYRLPGLEYVNLEYTELDRPTVERLGAELSGVRLNLRHVTTRFDQDDENWQEVHRLVKDGAEHLVRNDDRAVDLLEQALALCTDTASYSEYDELYARYGLINALGRLAEYCTGEKLAAVEARCVEHAKAALELVPQPGLILHFTDEGAFAEEVTRHAANAIGWYAMKDGRHEESLKALERGLALADMSEHGFIYDTKVRVLLELGRTHEAYLIVDQILTHHPDFDDLQDLRFDEGYLTWKADA
ncbi:leucine-rich repeat domain-containing protein [Stackebrandtia soli]|uniref:leucine-rich repeat domain-containing protein n=1 Tax=Stackebrandtia soli TaxID=1892856 RepID=UPI0039EB9746